MNVDLSGLVAELKDAEEAKTFVPPEVSEYVIQRIYGPLLRGEKVRFAELDFTAFSDEDLHDLERRIDASEYEYRCLANLNLVFCEAAPISTAVRAFC